MEAREAIRPTSLTLPMVIVGIVLGLLVCATNTYFGLQIGSLSTMSTPLALMSFAAFKSLSKWLPPHVFSPPENILVQSIASSIAGMPVATSLLSVIPAWEFLKEPEEGGKHRFSLLELFSWSLGVSLFGIFFSAPFRSYFLLRLRLRFPGGYATGVLVGLLHNDDAVARIVESEETIAAASSAERDHNERPGVSDWASNVTLMVKASASTAVWVLVSYFVPSLTQIPIFGRVAARDWLWFLTSSPAFMAFGSVLDLPVAISMTVGAIIGWGILSPIAKMYAWAPGLTDSMETGVRGWLIWISISSLLGDAFVKILHGIVMFALHFNNSRRPCLSQDMPPIAGREGDPSREPLLGNCVSSHGDPGGVQLQQSKNNNLVSKSTIVCGLFGSSLLCALCTYLTFQSMIPFYGLALAVSIAFPLCLIVIQSAGETDTIPSIGLSNACQFLFGFVTTNSAKASLVPMVLGGVTEAGLWQSAVLMTDLKAGYIVQASPKVMFHAQLLGSVLGAFISSGLYRLFTIAFSFPNASFPLPLAYLSANTARLVSGGDLPKGIGLTSLATFCLSASLHILRLVTGERSWRRWIPSGTAMAIGMFVPPSVTLAKLTGAAIRVYCTQKTGVPDIVFMSVATGCILGEGTLGFVPLIMESMGIPRWF